MKQQQQHRDSHEIIKAILEVLPDIPTRLQMKVNMAYPRLNFYLDHMINLGLISMIRGKHRLYVISNKGREYLHTINQLLVLTT